MEIKEHWPGFKLWLMYDNKDFPWIKNDQVIRRKDLKVLPNIEALRTEEMKVLFDPANKSREKRLNLILSSYESFAERATAIVTVKTTDDEYKQYQTQFRNQVEFMILDEANEAKKRTRETMQVAKSRNQRSYGPSTPPLCRTANG